MQRFNKSILPLLIILLVATGLRFYKFSDQAFTHDEFSTLFRLDYENLHDVIQIGMKELDNHPVGTQVFYYYYTKAFGSSEMAVKFPIILFGIFAVFMVYKITKKWFNSTSALYAASFMAFLQYAVAQSQIARMYGFGIPFILLMVYFWDKIIHKEFNLKNLLVYVFAASVCTYTHYFSLLFVAIVWITGIFLIEKKYWLKYILAGLSIFILFAPHLNIFFYQLSKGGIEGWLGNFELNYFFQYISYVFHNSWIIALLVIIPILVFFAKNKPSIYKRYRRISIIWFFIPIAIGFTYSYFVSNVIHERVLYFSFPFLLIFLASFIKKTTFRNELLLTIVLLLVGSASLFLERRHQEFFNNQRYKCVAETLIDWQKNIDPDSLLVVKFTYPEIDEYYNAKHNFKNNHTIYWSRENKKSDFINLLQQSDKEYFYFGRAEIINQTLLQIALSYYPEVVEKEYTLAGEAFLLKKSKHKYTEACPFINYEKELVAGYSDSSLITNNEYIGTIEAMVDTLIFSENNFIELSASITPMDTIGGAKIVSSMEKNGKIIDWRAMEINDFILSDSISNQVFFTIPIPDIRLKKETHVKFFIWNPNKAKYRIDNFSFYTRPGNPFIYGGTDKIPFNLSKYCL
ncbi:MAG: glycosyltransferase family 39 protein [Salinivirgaceae bacterium]|nr:glycosyltransferase family 39 protein [Salinivirgaceae bacterium]